MHSTFCVGVYSPGRLTSSLYAVKPYIRVDMCQLERQEGLKMSTVNELKPKKSGSGWTDGLDWRRAWGDIPANGSVWVSEIRCIYRPKLTTMRCGQPSREWSFIRRALTNSNPYRRRERERERAKHSLWSWDLLKWIRIKRNILQLSWSVLVVNSRSQFSCYRVIRWKVSRDADINWIGHEWNLERGGAGVGRWSYPHDRGRSLFNRIRQRALFELLQRCIKFLISWNRHERVWLRRPAEVVRRWIAHIP